MRDVIALENVEPKKKKGTLCKPGSRGGVFGHWDPYWAEGWARRWDSIQSKDVQSFT